jgi:hypothetical protein
MKQTHYLTATVQASSRLEVDLPDLPVGQTVEVIVILPESPPTSPSSIDRRAFLKLSLEERRQILEQQAEAALSHYQQNLEWHEWVNLDMTETDDDV